MDKKSQKVDSNITVSKVTTVTQSKVDTSVVVNPVAKKDWKKGTNELAAIFNAKDEEIEYWKSMCNQQETVITELEITSKQQVEDNTQELAQKTEEIAMLKRTLEEQKASNGYRIRQLEDQLAYMTAEFEKVRNLLIQTKTENEKIKAAQRSSDQRIQELLKIEAENKQRGDLIIILNNNIMELNQKCNNLERQLAEQTNKNKQLEGQVNLLLQEIEKLNQVIKKQNQDNMDLSQRLYQSEDKVAKQAQMLQDERVRVAQLTKEKELLEKKIAELEARINQLVQQILIQQEEDVKHSKTSSEMDSRLKMLQQEIERYKLIVNSLEGKIKQQDTIIGQYAQENQKITIQCNQQLVDIQRLTEQLNARNRECDELKARCQMYEEKLKQYENLNNQNYLEIQRLTTISNQQAAEIQRLTDQLNFRNSQYDELRSRCDQFENNWRNSESQLIVMTNKYNELQAKYDVQKKQLEFYLVEITNYKEQIIGFQQSIIDWESKVALLTSEIERLKAILSRRDAQIAEMEERYKKKVEELMLFKEKNQYLNKEIDRLAILVEEVETESAELKLQVYNMSQLQFTINDLHLLLVKLFAEIESLRSRVKAKQAEVDEVRRSSLKSLRS